MFVGLRVNGEWRLIHTLMLSHRLRLVRMRNAIVDQNLKQIVFVFSYFLRLEAFSFSIVIRTTNLYGHQMKILVDTSRDRCKRSDAQKQKLHVVCLHRHSGQIGSTRNLFENRRRRLFRICRMLYSPHKMFESGLASLRDAPLVVEPCFDVGTDMDCVVVGGSRRLLYVLNTLNWCRAVGNLIRSSTPIDQASVPGPHHLAAIMDWMSPFHSLNITAVVLDEDDDPEENEPPTSSSVSGRGGNE